MRVRNVTFGGLNGYSGEKCISKKKTPPSYTEPGGPKIVETHSYKFSFFGPALQFGGGSSVISANSFCIRFADVPSALEIFGLGFGSRRASSFGGAALLDIEFELPDDAGVPPLLTAPPLPPLRPRFVGGVVGPVELELVVLLTLPPAMLALPTVEVPTPPLPGPALVAFVVVVPPLAADVEDISNCGLVFIFLFFFF